MGEAAVSARCDDDDDDDDARIATLFLPFRSSVLFLKFFNCSTGLFSILFV